MKRFAVVLTAAVLSGAIGCNDSSEPEDTSETQPPATFLMARKPSTDLLEDQKAISRKYAKIKSSPVEAPATTSAPAESTGKPELFPTPGEPAAKPKAPTGPETKPTTMTKPEAPTGPETKPTTMTKPEAPTGPTDKIITPKGETLRPGKSSPKAATATSAPLISHKLPAGYKPGLTNEQAYAVFTANMKGPMTVWTETVARSKAEKTSHTLQKKDIAAIKEIMVGAKENLTLATGGSVWVCFESVAIRKAPKSAALIAALKKMNIPVPAKVKISVNPQDGIFLIYRWPGPYKYFDLK